MHVPATPAELTTAQVTELLGPALGGGTVTEIECTDIGEGTGIFGQIARLDRVGMTDEAHDGTGGSGMLAA